MISVCIPTFNGEKYIKEQIDSILPQLSINDEVVVSDDGSIDQTLSILNAFKDDRIKIFRHDKKKQKYKFGYTTANVENALSHARGDVIFLADQDDVWLPGKVDSLIKQLNDRCQLVLSDCAITDSRLNIICSSKFRQDQVKTGVLQNLWKCGYLGCCMAFKRDILKKCLPIPSNVPHDLWIGIITAKRQTLYPHVTMLYRRHDENVSATNNKLLGTVSDNEAKQLTPNRNSLIFKLKYRCVVVFAYIKRLYRTRTRVRRDSNSVIES